MKLVLIVKPHGYYQEQLVYAQTVCGIMKEHVKIVVINVKNVQMPQTTVLGQIVLETELETIAHAKNISMTTDIQPIVKNVVVNVTIVQLMVAHHAQELDLTPILANVQHLTMNLSHILLEILNVLIKPEPMMELVRNVIILVKPAALLVVVTHVN